MLLLREFLSDDYDKVEVADLLSQASQPKALWNARCNVAKRLGVSVDAVFCPRDYPEGAEEIPLITYVADIQPSSYKPGNVETMTFSDIQAKIASLRGFSFQRVKPLNAARTRLECALRNTADPWPGDLDGVMLYKDQPICTLEFKTHNLNTPIEQEHIGKYGPQDWRRFRVQYAIQRAMGMIPILYIVWGPHHPKVKIDRIARPEVVDETSVISNDPFELAETVLALSQ